MTIRQLLNLGAKKISKASDSPILDSEVLLSHVLNKSKEYLHLHLEKNLLRNKVLTFTNLIDKRMKGWPVAYLTHQKEFYSLNFYVDNNVLIPRPETEGLVDLVLKQIQDSRLKIQDPLRILDVGTGSGNIIISLAKSLYNLSPTTYNLFASDISKSALAVARKNAKQHKVKITFTQGSLLDPWKGKQFDIIVANLPYLAKETHPSTEFEPKTALVAKKKGLELFQKLFKQLYTLHPKPYTLFLEIGLDQASVIKNLAAKLLPGSRTQIYKDLYKRNRYAIIYL